MAKTAGEKMWREERPVNEETAISGYLNDAAIAVAVMKLCAYLAARKRLQLRESGNEKKIGMAAGGEGEIFNR